MYIATELGRFQGFRAAQFAESLVGPQIRDTPAFTHMTETWSQIFIQQLQSVRAGVIEYIETFKGHQVTIPSVGVLEVPLPRHLRPATSSQYGHI